MNWLFVGLLLLCVAYSVDTGRKNPSALLGGIYLVMLDFVVERLNVLFGPVWLADRSVELLQAGQPAEVPLIALFGGTFLCNLLPKERRIILASILFGLGGAVSEFILTVAGLLKWLNYWGFIHVAVMYFIIGYLTFNFYYLNRKYQLINLLIAAFIIAVLFLVPK
jgi:hypothetical protein